MHNTIDTFKFVDAAMQYSDDSEIVAAASLQWTCMHNLVKYILDYIPEEWKEDYLDDVTHPNF